MADHGGGDDDRPDYSGLDRLGEDDVFDPNGNTESTATASTNVELQTLMQLQHGINGAAARQQIEQRVYRMGVVANFALTLLNKTSGALHPSCFNSQTLQL
jgi:hypothetical protein